MLYFIILIILLQLLLVSLSQGLPKDIQKCHFGDAKCLVDTMNMVIRKYPKGIPELGLKAIDKVDINDTSLLSSQRFGFFWMNIDLVNQVNYGFENATITGVEGFDKDPTTSYVKIYGKIPSLIHKGDFKTVGRLWLVGMNTTGQATSDFQNFHFDLKLKVIMEYRNNTRYLKIYQLVPIVTMDRWSLHLDGLFRDNTDLTLAINSLYNEYWVEFWNDLEPSILKTFSNVFTYMFEDVFKHVPYDDLFLPDDK